MKTIHPNNKWYIVNNTGDVNLYTEDNKVDARLSAIFCDIDYPEHAPHKAVQLVDAEVARDLINALRKQLADVRRASMDLTRALAELRKP